jgi:hypothetical protein
VLQAEKETAETALNGRNKIHGFNMFIRNLS